MGAVRDLCKRKLHGNRPIRDVSIPAVSSVSSLAHNSGRPLDMDAQPINSARVLRTLYRYSSSESMIGRSAPSENFPKASRKSVGMTRLSAIVLSCVFPRRGCDYRVSRQIIKGLARCCVSYVIKSVRRSIRVRSAEHL